MFHKEVKEKTWGKVQADGLYAKQEEGWREREERTQVEASSTAFA
jgi:hypothetical protein